MPKYVSLRIKVWQSLNRLLTRSEADNYVQKTTNRVWLQWIMLAMRYTVDWSSHVSRFPACSVDNMRALGLRSFLYIQLRRGVQNTDITNLRNNKFRWHGAWTNTFTAESCTSKLTNPNPREISLSSFITWKKKFHWYKYWQKSKPSLTEKNVLWLHLNEKSQSIAAQLSRLAATRRIEPMEMNSWFVNLLN